jgi:L,D-peptidoglycan transpeptidase YkuD (ErfK/YbiS/YcfS/YnhG family)
MRDAAGDAMRALKTKNRPAPAGACRDITVFSSPRERHRGLVRCGALSLPCALGRSGVSHLKREGDGATPAGRHRLLSLIVRPDRGLHPRAAVPIRAMRKNDGWCEDRAHGSYNRPIRLPSSAGHETMWRGDQLYDVVGVLDWNFRPRIRGCGSAIFLHLARPGYGPTAGCIALNRRDLTLLLAAAGPRPRFLISADRRRLAEGRRP